MVLPLVHLLTDRRIASDLAARADAALAGLPPGVAAIHLREKDLGGRDLLREARALAAVCRRREQVLIVNDRLDVAMAGGAAGVHLPADGVSPADARRLLTPEALIGVSCHSAADVVRARDGGASYAFLSPIFETPSKRPYGPPIGIDALRAAVPLGLPLVALGGVTPERALALFSAGARGVAAIRAWLAAVDASAAVRAFLAASRQAQSVRSP